MRLATQLRTRRRGFTLVEVLVAAGLCMLIMLMITTAFQKAMDTLSQLKSVGEMQQRLRAFETAVRGDLTSDHFEGGDSGNRVRDQRLDVLAATGLNNSSTPWKPPAMGFFRVQQGSINDGFAAGSATVVARNYGMSINEGMDSDFNPSTRATNHILHFTVKRNASRGDKVFSTSIATMPAANQNALRPINMLQMSNDSTALTSDWAEVVYFLDTQNQIGTTPGGLPLFGLYRRLRVLPNSGNPSTMSWTTMSAANKVGCQGLSHSNATGMLNSPVEVRDPSNRLGGKLGNRVGTGTDNVEAIAAEKDTTGVLGSDLLVTDVLSFEIKADWDGGTRRPGQSDASAALDLSKTYEFPFSDLPEAPSSRNTTPGFSGLRVFDTWFQTSDLDATNPQWLTNGNPNTVPQPMRMRAIQIKVRVWDRKNNMARQITLVQDL